MSVDYSHVTFISAGAGSGKTHRLIEDLERALVDSCVNPAAVIGTTFTVKAAGELSGRVQSRLIERGLTGLAEQMTQALIGTVHSVCERLLKRFSFELGLSPELNVMSVEDGGRLFNQALDEVLGLERVRTMNALAAGLGQEDWQLAVKAVADKVRENDIAANALAEMGARNADALLDYFPPALAVAPDEELARAIVHALAAIDPRIDTTKLTRNYVRLLEQSQRELMRARASAQDSWPVWIRLSVEGAGAKSDAHAAAVRAAAARYAAHPRFHADVRAYIAGVMEIAALALERFQAQKTDRGLIDFLDMEQLMLRSLDEPAVQSRLGEELELLLVDEFQDTNPMQLAVFLKLATLADRAIFVGDVKQAIYAFRGCDPALVFETLAALVKADARTDRLPGNWRSRPALVEYVNAVFAAAFDGEIPAEDVILAAARPERTAEPAVVHWRLAGASKGPRAVALAEAVAALVADGFRVVDRDSGEPRPVRYGDIAVLARTNDNVELVARTLKQYRVPMKMTLSGLLETPEVCLARACLRRLNDPGDTLATAEIVALADCATPESWLPGRLGWVASEAENYRWAEDAHPLVARLAALRADSALRSPVEIVARVLNDVGTRHIAVSWGADRIKAAQRQRNLDAFLDLAVAYEGHCESHHDAATLTGFLFWLEEPSSPELDLQPVVTAGDAVHVLTYHRAKGLEWPVVVVTDFDYAERSSVWDVRVLAGRMDVEAPLAGRTIRFWPNPFGNRTKGLPVRDAIEGSAEGLACARASDAERRRLAYVGMTRARDLLAIALPEKPLGEGAWFHSFGTAVAIPEGDELALPNGEAVATRVADFTGTGRMAASPAFQPRWFLPRERRGVRVRESVNPSLAAPLESARMGEVVDLGRRIPLHGGEMTAIGNALHAVIAARLVNADAPEALQGAREILRAYGVDAFVDAADAIAAADRLRAALAARYPGARIRVEYPVTHALGDGRVVRGFVDLLVETDLERIVIDHKSSPRPRSEWSKDLVLHAGQLRIYAEALNAADPRQTRLLLHFPVGGGLVEVEAREE